MALLKAVTKYGIAEGVDEMGITVFKGIPFAAPPVGKLRFMPPEKPEKWSGTRLFAQWPVPPVQLEKKFSARPQDTGKRDDRNQHERPPMLKGNEDCLYLNVFTDAKSADEKRPVMVWIFGGGFQGGHCSGAEMRGYCLAKKGVVLVTLNYRCGVLGFAAHDFLSARSPLGTSGNYGLLDQKAALEWVKDNIAAFGGDPNRITIFGQSAGGMSCKFHLCSEQSRGLFNRVIIQSGGGLNAGDPTRPAVEMCSITERSLLSAGWTPEDLLEKDAQELTDALGNAAMSLMEGKELFIFQPCIDGSFLKELPEKTISEGTYNTDADIICGTVNGDSWMFTRKVRKQLENNPEALHAFSFAPGVSWGRHQIHTGRKPIYSYYFERDQGNGVAPHASEIPYIFGTLECRPGPNSEIDHKLSEAMSDYWCNFAKNGNPNGSGLEEWPLYTEKTPYVMHFKNDAWNAENIAEDPESIHVMDYTEAHPGMLESLDGFID